MKNIKIVLASFLIAIISLNFDLNASGDKEQYSTVHEVGCGIVSGIITGSTVGLILNKCAPANHTFGLWELAGAAFLHEFYSWKLNEAFKERLKDKNIKSTYLMNAVSMISATLTAGLILK